MDKFRMMCDWLDVELSCGITRMEAGIIGLVIIGVVVVICNRKLWKKFF